MYVYPRKFSPMLSPRETAQSFKAFWETIQYPLLMSPKFDGIRGVVQDGTVLSRTVKPLRSYQVQDEFGGFEGCDGELVVGDPTVGTDVYIRTNSSVMAFNNPADVNFFVFDYITPETQHLEYWRRLEIAKSRVDPAKQVFFVEHEEANNKEEVLAIEERYLALNYEGAMGYSPVGTYKLGRATINEWLTYKFKRFIDAELVIVDILPGTNNNNPQQIDVRGFAFRSKAMAGLVESDMAGVFVCLWKDDILLNVAPSKIPHDMRREMLRNKHKYIGKFLKVRWFGYGIKDLPRSPRALGLRDPMDM